MAMVQDRGRQQFESDDRARKGAGHPDDETVDTGQPGRQPHPISQQGEDDRTDQGDADGFLYLSEQFARRQVESEQKQQEDDPDMGELGDEMGIGYQTRDRWPRDHTHRDVGDQQRLARKQRHRGEQRRPGEDQEYGK